MFQDKVGYLSQSRGRNREIPARAGQSVRGSACKSTSGLIKVNNVNTEAEKSG